MDQVIKESGKIIATLANLFKKDGMDNEFQVLSQGTPIIEKTGYNTWDGGRVGLPRISRNYFYFGWTPTRSAMNCAKGSMFASTLAASNAAR
jgi:hypothetical protein